MTLCAIALSWGSSEHCVLLCFYAWMSLHSQFLSNVRACYKAITAPATSRRWFSWKFSFWALACTCIYLLTICFHHIQMDQLTIKPTSYLLNVKWDSKAVVADSQTSISTTWLSRRNGKGNIRSQCILGSSVFLLQDLMNWICSWKD